ncbi:MAG: hypothetical protein H8E44_40900 [Planctomycetes bacterium]|nr:hypothetical protein [Planctomycetota bacterium]
MNTVFTYLPSRMSRHAWALVIALVTVAVLPTAILWAEEAETDASRNARREAAMERGMLAVQAESWKLAAQYFEVARQADTCSPEALRNLALANDRMGGRELPALAWFQAFLATEPDAPTAAMVRKRILALEIGVEAKLLSLLQAAEKTARLITDADEKSARIKDIARMQAQLKEIVGQVEGSEDGQKPDQAASKKAENIREWTRRAHYWREKQVIVNFDGFVRGQQGKSPAEATRVLVVAALELKVAVLLARSAPVPRENLVNALNELDARRGQDYVLAKLAQIHDLTRQDGDVERVEELKALFDKYDAELPSDVSNPGYHDSIAVRLVEARLDAAGVPDDSPDAQASAARLEHLAKLQQSEWALLSPVQANLWANSSCGRLPRL